MKKGGKKEEERNGSVGKNTEAEQRGEHGCG